MRKRLHKKSVRNFSKLPPKQRSYAMALIRTKTIQFFIGCLVFATLVFGVGIIVSKIKVIKFVQTKKAVVITPRVTAVPQYQSQYYVLKEGESLWDVASKAYGNPNEYTKLIDLNNLTDPNSVNPGTRLRIR